MNKLIIIGNGFDLAHGYPTRYTDFILWLVKSELKLLYGQLHHLVRRIENPLFNCSIKEDIYFNSYMPETIYDYIDQNLLSIMNRATKEDYMGMVYFTGQRNYHSENNDVFTVSAEGDFSKKILKNVCENWVDIEQTYYKSLKEILDKTIENINADVQEEIIDLNSQLSYLCSKLREYLISLNKDVVIPEFKVILNKEIDYQELFKPEEWKNQDDFDIEELQANSKTFVLNFNYTNIINQYFEVQESGNVIINNIHGSISDDNNPMIFGYGDELDDSFSAMEKQEIKGFLEHAKSLWYLRTRNYHNLIRFIESGYYQVQIIGHSCGRSDRTLLNMVFEHDNCNSVDIYYRKLEDGSDSFNEISEEVSRQFKDKQKLRKRVLPKNPSNIIPQYKVIIKEEEIM